CWVSVASGKKMDQGTQEDNMQDQVVVSGVDSVLKRHCYTLLCQSVVVCNQDDTSAILKSILQDSWFGTNKKQTKNVAPRSLMEWLIDPNQFLGKQAKGVAFGQDKQTHVYIVVLGIWKVKSASLD
ncbi:hypothetical protein MBANPS3_011043, partial [Mucor bainieri]